MQVEARKIARAIRESWQSKDKFQASEFVDELDGKLHHLEVGAYRAFVEKVADDIDREFKKDRLSNQPLLAGLEWDTEGELHLDGLRVPKRMARVDHARLALEIDDENRAAVDRRNDEKHEEFKKLEPFWIRNRTKIQAIAAYEKANPKTKP